MAKILPSPDNRFRAGRVPAALTLALVIGLTCPGWPATLDVPSSHIVPTLSPGRAFVEADGASLYANICQGCHMRDGRGAAGAAAYPSLVANANLQSAPFVVEVVLKGLKGMPPIGRSMSDDQVAAVVNYVRRHFENTSDDQVSSADVRALRGP